MTIHEEVLHYLESNPTFRERKNRGRLLFNLTLRSLSLGSKYAEGQKLTMQEMIDFAVKYDTYRHAWTDVLKASPDLRGSDYQDKEALVEEKLVELGYR